jgi:RND family efflux transporter MFP subunit
MRYFIYIHLLAFLFISCGKKTNETKPVRKDISEAVFASGVLEPENKYSLIAQSEGYIIDLKFGNGQTVKAGQVLALIDNRASEINAESSEQLLGLAGQNASPEGPTLKQAQSNLQLLKEKFIQDSIQHLRYHRLHESNSISKLELETARLAYENSKTNYINASQNYRLLKQQVEQQLIIQRSQRDISTITGGYNEIKSIHAGKVYKKFKEEGEYVRRGDIIAIIGNADTLHANLNVDENNITKIKVGQEVLVQLNVNSQKTYKAKIYEIVPSFDEAKQSFICKAHFTDKLDFNISGTQLQANIIVAEKKNVLVIPKAFLGYGNKVKTKSKGEIVIQPGFISGEWVEILSGLDENETIISEKTQ